MSLYREARSGRRRLWFLVGVAAAALVAVAVAVVLAVVVGGEPTESERLTALQADVQPALAALELVPIHYESPDPTTHAAAADQLKVAHDTVAKLADELRARDADGTEAVLRDLAELAALVRTTGRVAAVEARTSAAAERLRALVGLARSPG